MNYVPYSIKQTFMVRLPQGEDLLAAVAAVVRETGSGLVSFSVIGAASAAAFGYYDQTKKEYQTIIRLGEFEIVTGSGNVSLKTAVPLSMPIFCLRMRTEILSAGTSCQALLFLPPSCACRSLKASRWSGSTMTRPGCFSGSSRLLKNTRLLCCAPPSSLRRTVRVRLIPQDFARRASGCF